jgi:hypothetical protein
MAILAILVDNVARLAQLMAGGAFLLFTGNIGTLGTIGILSVMAGGAFLLVLMGLMIESHVSAGFLGGVEGHDLRSLGQRDSGYTANHGQGGNAKHDFFNHFFLSLKLMITPNEYEFIMANNAILYSFKGEMSSRKKRGKWPERMAIN